MKYVIWGAGERGARLLPHLNPNEVEAFIDKNPEKVGKIYCGKKIISFDEYKKEYFKCNIIISYMHEDEIISELKENGIYNYFLMTDCPGEFQESYPRDILKNHILSYLRPNKKYVIYGCTLYSLMLNEWIKKKCGSYTNIIWHTDIDKKLIDSLSYQQTTQKFYTLEDLNLIDVDEILVTVEQDMEKVQNYVRDEAIVTNVYDCSDQIDEYYNPEIEKFKNIHKGNRCFIVATGPSLKIEDLDTLVHNQEICISFNSIWRAFDKTKWRPQYYLAMDYRILRDYGDIMENQNIPYMFWGDTYKEYWDKAHAKKHLKHHFVYEYSEKRLPKFSEDFARKSYMGSTVTYQAIQLAVYMGFKEIYLLGVDFSAYGNPDKPYPHFHEEEPLRSISYGDRQNYLAYEMAKKYADEHNIHIYNSTRGGKLEIFPRVHFDSLFEENNREI